MRDVLAVGALFQVEVLGRRQVGEPAVRHVQTAGFKLSDQAVFGRTGEDVMLNPVHEGAAVFEIVLILVDLVKVANLVFFQDERAGGGAPVKVDGFISGVNLAPSMRQMCLMRTARLAAPSA